MKPTGYADLHTVPEDDRITTMANHVRQTGQTCLVVTDADPGKAERYVRKFKQHHPDVAVVSEIMDGPTPGCRCFRIGPQ